MLSVLDMMTLSDYWRTHEVDPEPEAGYLWFKQDDDESRKIEDIFWDNLCPGNHFDAKTKHFLEINGYRVWAGDKDSFGILVACVAKDGKAFSFG